MSLSPEPAKAPRRHDLDWIRVGAFGLLIFYHVGMFYVPWDWHVKSPHPVEWLEPVMMLTNPWRLTLLFLVSGAATRFMAEKMSVAALTGLRIGRLLPPLIFAMFVIVPPQSYFQIMEAAPGAVGGYLDFWGKYATGSGHWCRGDDCLVTPTWNHMWFVAYLIFYTLVLTALMATAPRLLKAAGDALERLPVWALLLAPIVFLALIRITMLSAFPETHALFNDWYNHALSFSAFLFGFLMAPSERLRQAFITLRWPALALAVLGYAGWASYAWIWRADGAVPPEALRLAMRAVYAVDQWGAIAAVLGFGARHLTRGGPVLTWLTLAVFPFYIVHQTIIVVAGHFLARLGLWQPLEAAILIATTVAGCLLTYVIVSRIGFLRPLFGLKPRGG